MLSAQHLSHAVIGKQLFNNLNVSLQAGDKVALVGRNGSGKSTLLQILSGELNADEGEVTVSQKDRVSLITQNLNVDQKVYQLINARLKVELIEVLHLPKQLSILGISRIDPQKKISTLSGGQQLRLQLALALCNKPTLLLIDEPTNHLDTAGRDWLIEFLQSFKGGYLVVSHDRDFLDRTVDMVYELEDQKLNQYVGGYSEYVIQKEQQRDNLHEKYRVQENYKDRIINDIANTKRGAQEREAETKLDTSRRLAAKSAKKAVARAKRLDQQMNSAEWIEKPKRSHSLILDIVLPTKKRHRVSRLSNLNIGFTDKHLIREVSASIYSDDHIALLGENGSGKSVLIKTILGELRPLEGEVKLESKVGYLSQQNNLDNSASPLQTLMSTGINQAASRGVLDRLGYNQSQINQPIGSLSAGETVKLRLAHMMLQDFDFLILDEPTNNLDFESVEVVEQLLRESPIGYMVVTHDRYLLTNLPLTTTWQIYNKQLNVSTK